MLIVWLLTGLWAQSSAVHVCERTDDTAIEMLTDSDHRLDFGNQGGLLDGGVCWWHSRFERAASYVAQFKPQKNKPTLSEAKRIVQKISRMQFVVIPGYRNLIEFSSDFQDVIQNELNAWQVRDGFINQAWLNGLSGVSQMNPDKLERHMKKIVEKFNAHPYPMFLKLQIKGITAHAFILLGVTEHSRGYELEVTDSNSPGTVRTLYYYKGSRSINDYGTEFVPYIDFNKDIKTILTNKKAYCKLAQRLRK